MKSYKEEIRKLGIRKEYYVKYSQISDNEYNLEYKTQIYKKQMKENIMKFIEYKINNLQETLKKMRADDV